MKLPVTVALWLREQRVTFVIGVSGRARCRGKLANRKSPTLQGSPTEISKLPSDGTA